MRKMWLIAVALCMFAGLSLAQSTNEVTSVNVVGYVKVTMPSNGYALVALNFDSLDSTNANVYGVLGTQMVAAATPTLADQALFYDVSQQRYKTYARKSSDGLYHDTSAWTGAATNPPLLPGMALWLKQKSGATSSKDIVLMGEAVSVVTQSVNLVTGYQLVGYSFSSDISIDKLSVTNSGRAAATPALADQLLFWTGSKYESYGLKTDRRWHSTTNWTGAASSNTIRVGQGVWYLSRTNFVWSETNMYLNNL